MLAPLLALVDTGFMANEK